MTGDGAPWTVRLDAVAWWHRARPGATAALPPALRGSRVLPVTMGALVRYHDTPVGPYDELLAVPVLLLDGVPPAGHVPFMVVDAAASARAGRRNWALPKRVAGFAWNGLEEADVREADGAALVAARTRAAALRVPFAIAGRGRQVRPSGAPLRFLAAAAGRAAPAWADIRTGAAAPAWLASGRHPALVVRGARMRVGRAAAG
jgi:hypothetical protein